MNRRRRNPGFEDQGASVDQSNPVAMATANEKWDMAPAGWKPAYLQNAPVFATGTTGGINPAAVFSKGGVVERPESMGNSPYGNPEQEMPGGGGWGMPGMSQSPEQRPLNPSLAQVGKIPAAQRTPAQGQALKEQARYESIYGANPTGNVTQLLKDEATIGNIQKQGAFEEKASMAKKAGAAEVNPALQPNQPTPANKSPSAPVLGLGIETTGVGSAGANPTVMPANPTMESRLDPNSAGVNSAMGPKGAAAGVNAAMGNTGAFAGSQKGFGLDNGSGKPIKPETPTPKLPGGGGVGYALRDMGDGTFTGISSSMNNGKSQVFNSFAAAMNVYRPGSPAAAVPAAPQQQAAVPPATGSDDRERSDMNQPAVSPVAATTAAPPAPTKDSPKPNPGDVNIGPFTVGANSPLNGAARWLSGTTDNYDRAAEAARQHKLRYDLEKAKRNQPPASVFANPAAAMPVNMPSQATAAPVSPAPAQSQFTSPTARINTRSKKLGQPSIFGTKFQAQAPTSYV